MHLLTILAHNSEGKGCVIVKKANPYGYNSWTDGAIKVINPDECGFFMVHLSFFKQKNYTGGKKFNRKAFKGIVLGVGSVVLDVIDVVIHSNNRHADYNYWTFWYGTLTHYQNQCDFDLILADGTVVKCYTETEEVIELLETYRNPISARAEFRPQQRSALPTMRNDNFPMFYIDEGVLIKYTGTTIEAIIPNNVKIIGSGAFYKCNNLKSVIVSNSVTNIGYGAFHSCTGLSNVIIGNSVISIGEAAFALCKELTNVTLGDNVKNIGKLAFGGCAKLASVTIPESVSSISIFAFGDCVNLERVRITDSIKSIEYGAFQGCTKLNGISFRGMTYHIKKGKDKNGIDIYDFAKIFYDVVNGGTALRMPSKSPSPAMNKTPINDEIWRIVNSAIPETCAPPVDYDDILAKDYDSYIAYLDYGDMCIKNYNGKYDQELKEIEQELEEERLRDEEWKEEEQEKAVHGYGWQRWVEEKKGRGMDNWVDDDVY